MSASSNLRGRLAEHPQAAFLTVHLTLMFLALCAASLQALANNLLSRAVTLARHAAVGPDAALCCAVGIAELQLSQAHAMLASGGAMAGLAAALLSSSYQQLCSTSLADAAASGSPHAAGLLDAKKQASRDLCNLLAVCDL